MKRFGLGEAGRSEDFLRVLRQLARATRKWGVLKSYIGFASPLALLLFILPCSGADTDCDGIDDSTEQAILDRYRPWLYYDTGESIWPCSATWFVQHSSLIGIPGGYYIDQSLLMTNPGAILSPTVGGSWSLTNKSSSLKLNIDDNFRLGQFSEVPPQSVQVPIYGDVMPLPSDWAYKGFNTPFTDGAYLVQYWILFPYNNCTKWDYYGTTDTGDHEGDIVWLDLILDRDASPLYVVYHHHGDATIDPTVVPYSFGYDGAPIAYLEAGTHELWPFPAFQGGVQSPIHAHMGQGVRYKPAKVLNVGQAGHPMPPSAFGQQADELDARLFLQFNGEWGDYTGQSYGIDDITNPGGPLNQNRGHVGDGHPFPFGGPKLGHRLQIIGAKDIVRTNDPGKCSAVVNFNVTAYDQSLSNSLPPVQLQVFCWPISGYEFPIGTTPVECVASDDCAGSNIFKTFYVTVLDANPPVFTYVSAWPPSIGPADNSLVPITLNCLAVAHCPGPHGVYTNLQPTISISCNEPTSGAGDPNTAPDWVIDASFKVRLRAKNSPGGQGRVYTITFTVRDSVGNFATTNIFLPVLADAITGFGYSGQGWTFNGANGAAPPSGGDGELFLTSVQNYSTARSAFFDRPQSIGQFTASFIYNDLTGPGQGGGPFRGDYNPADGVVFTLQRQGPTAVGGSGAQLGYGGISSACGVAFNIYGGSATGYVSNTVPSSGDSSYLDTSPVDLRSGHWIQVTLAYDGKNLREDLLDTTTHAAFSKTYLVDIPAAVGGPTAFVGFTGATGVGAADQRIYNFTFWPRAMPDPSQQFRNLDFEDTSYSTQPSPWALPPNLALPGWTTFSTCSRTGSTRPVTNVYLDEGASSLSQYLSINHVTNPLYPYPTLYPESDYRNIISIQDTGGSSGAIQGNVTLRLESEPFSSAPSDVRPLDWWWHGGIAQRGVVPSNAPSLHFKLDKWNPLALLVSDVEGYGYGIEVGVPYKVLYTDGVSVECAADISQFAGKLVTLKFYAAGAVLYLDYIRFVDRLTNRPPFVQRNVFAAALQNQPLYLNLSNLLSVVSDPEGDLLTVSGADLTTRSGGTVLFTGPNFAYRPPRDYRDYTALFYQSPGGDTGADQFSYTISDGYGGFATNTVKVIVLTTNATTATVVNGPVIANGQFMVQFAGVPGITYTIQSTDNLATHLWTSRTSLVAPAADQGLGIGIFEFTDSISAEPNRFYRAVCQGRP